MNFRKVWTTAAALALLVLGMQLRDVLPNAADRAAESFDYASSAPIIGDVDDVQVTLAANFNGTASKRWRAKARSAFTPRRASPSGRC